MKKADAAREQVEAAEREIRVNSTIEFSADFFERMASAAREHVRECKNDHPLKHRLFEVAATHFEKAVEEIRKGHDAFKSTL